MKALYLKVVLYTNSFFSSDNFKFCGKILLGNSRIRMKCNSVLSKPKSSSFQISSSVSNMYIVFPCQQGATLHFTVTIFTDPISLTVFSLLLQFSLPNFHCYNFHHHNFHCHNIHHHNFHCRNFTAGRSNLT